MVSINANKNLGNYDDGKSKRTCFGARYVSPGNAITEAFRGIFHSMHFDDNNSGDEALDL